MVTQIGAGEHKEQQSLDHGKHPAIMFNEESWGHGAEAVPVGDHLKDP